MPNASCQRNSRRGFTLIELLVVIGIIVILVGILLPVVSSMRKRAQNADTTAELTRIATAIQNYYQDFRSYPGPIPETQIYGNNNSATAVVTGVPPLTVLSSSQNLVLGLEGGIISPGIGTYSYASINVTQGPQSLNFMAPQKYPTYYDATQAELPSMDASGAYQSWTKIQGTGYTTPILSPVPEFLDHFSNPHPIIYLRAVTGAGGVANGVTVPVCDAPRSSSSPGSQYFTLEMGPYWRIYPNFPNLASPQPITATSNPISTKDVNGNTVYTSAASFFQNPSLSDGFTPRSKDSFILISAGYDGIYGNADDVIISN